MTLSSTDVPSPCINVCTMNDSSGLCNGCWRTLDEIAWWSQLDDDDKRAVWVALRQRREQATASSMGPT
jgi:uncharacterized protein